MKKMYLGLLLILSACATPYQYRGITGGYTDMQLSEDVYKVTFRGNAFASSETVYNYFLYRCAEIAKENGCLYFIILDEHERVRTSTNYSSRVVGDEVRTRVTDYDKSTMIGKIKILKDKPNLDEVYDVDVLLQNIKVVSKDGKKQKRQEFWAYE